MSDHYFFMVAEEYLNMEEARELREEMAQSQAYVLPEVQAQLIALLKKGNVAEFNELRARNPGWLCLTGVGPDDVRQLDLTGLNMGKVEVTDEGIDLIRKFLCRHWDIQKLKYLRSGLSPVHGPYYEVWLVRCKVCGEELEESIPKQ